MITIRRAEINDIPSIMKFLDEHWKPGNLLATDREFFLWQFSYGEELNFFIAIDESIKKIYGTYGLVLYNQSEHPDVSGFAWQVIKSGNPILGMQIPEYSAKEIPARYYIGTHITEKAQRLERAKGSKVIPMDHYYRLNPEADYRIAVVVDKVVPEVGESSYSLEEIFAVSEMQEVISEDRLLTFIPSKDYRYIKHRYFDHPVYTYRFWKIVDENGVSDAVMITRTVEYDGSGCLRIVDFYGDEERISMITAGIDEILLKNNLEYADIYSYGVPTELYERAGFLPVDGGCRNILPNHFHPFEQKNVDLITIDQGVPGMRYFRGDGDQDRPG